jgi:Holliday junction resolvase RusA-like endonuclease
MTAISFFALGTPVAQPRHRSRAFMLKNKTTGRPIIGKHGQPIWTARAYDPGNAESWKSEIAMAAQSHVPADPITSVVALELTFYLPRPLSHYGTGKNAGKLKESAPMFCETKPDLDNLEKAVMDTLTRLRFWLNDNLVVKKRSEKLYENPPALKPGCQITIVPLENKAATSAARFVMGDAPAASGAEQPLLIQT